MYATNSGTFGGEGCTMGSPSVGRITFGCFQADLASRELHKEGSLVHLQDQPFRILSLLVERPGHLVTREEIKQKLWPDGTFVDFDEGIDTALKKLRQALADSADNPIFIETIPRRGYRFIAPVTVEVSREPGNNFTVTPPVSDPLPASSGNGSAFSAYSGIRNEFEKPFRSLSIPWTRKHVLVIAAVILLASLGVPIATRQWLSWNSVPSLQDIRM